MPDLFQHLSAFGKVRILHTPARVVVIQVRSAQQNGVGRDRPIPRCVMLRLLGFAFPVFEPVVVGREVDVPHTILLTEDKVEQNDFGQFLHPENHLFRWYAAAHGLVQGGVG